MGTWGTELFSDDVAYDVKEYYMNCLREQMSAKEAEDAVTRYFDEYLSNTDDGPIVILALADTAWHVGRLSDDLKKAAINIIDMGKGMERWEGLGEKFAQKRRDSLKKIKKKLLSPQPPEKKIYKHKLYKCQWKIGDVFAYRFESIIAKEKGYYGRYLLLQKVHEGSWNPGHRVPIVHFRLSKDNNLPSIDEINDIKCVKIASKKSVNLYDYRGKLINSSKKIIPNSLIYLGNTDVVFIENEYQHTNDISYFNFQWKYLEKRIIELYESFNLE